MSEPSPAGAKQVLELVAQMERAKATGTIDGIKELEIPSETPTEHNRRCELQVDLMARINDLMREFSAEGGKGLHAGFAIESLALALGLSLQMNIKGGIGIQLLIAMKMYERMLEAMTHNPSKGGN